LGIALQELARVDYESLSFEQIAERAGVNKVTLYRRWPTKRDLIQAALARLGDQVPLPVDTGALRSDLQLYLRTLADFMSRADTRAAFHTLFVTDTQLRELAIAVRRDKEAQADRIIARAIARGELPEQVDRALFQSLLVGVVADRVVLMRETLNEVTIGRIIDMVVHGATTAKAATERPGKPARKRAPKRTRDAHVPKR
jgi:AcrR family transcriptional regulator